MPRGLAIETSGRLGSIAIVDGSAVAAEGIAVAGVVASPLLGPAGNVEFLLHGRREEGPGGAADVPSRPGAILPEGESAIDSAVAEGSRLAGRHE